MSLTLDEAARLEEILATLGEVKSKLYPNARRFVEDLEARYDEHGADMFMSGPQWKWAEDLAAQFG